MENIAEPTALLTMYFMQIPGVIVMEVVSDKGCTNDAQWKRILITFNASSIEYKGALSHTI